MEDLDVRLMLDGSLFGKPLEGSLVLGPRSQMGALWVRLLQGDVATVRAVACEVFGHEMPSACQGCEDGPFPLCVADRNNACSNCIYTGSDRVCHWRKLGDNGAVGEEEHNAVDRDHDAINQDEQDAVDDNDHAPPKIQRPSSPLPPTTQRAGRKRSTDPDFVPPKRYKAGDSDDVHYVPPKTRNASSIEGKDYCPSLNRRRRSIAESDSGDAAPYEVIDLTGDD
ncbi:hypothetical protein GE09DRAFT_638857 [Coniochaeta sp. 2T2.1]|nr:hypothetical protein GE09DRAFT_638857 [Coniochaeta sp. 2T2.1]